MLLTGFCLSVKLKSASLAFWSDSHVHKFYLKSESSVLILDYMLKGGCHYFVSVYSTSDPRNNNSEYNFIILTNILSISFDSFFDNLITLSHVFYSNCHGVGCLVLSFIQSLFFCVGTESSHTLLNPPNSLYILNFYIPISCLSS